MQDRGHNDEEEGHKSRCLALRQEGHLYRRSSAPTTGQVGGIILDALAAVRSHTMATQMDTGNFLGFG